MTDPYGHGALRLQRDRIITVLPFDLTWQSHEFLDTIRTDTMWNKVKKYVGEKGLSITMAPIPEKDRGAF